MAALALPAWILAILALLGAVAYSVIKDLLKDASSSLLKKGWNKVRGKSDSHLTLDRKGEATEAVRLNVASTNKRLRDIIAQVVGGNPTSPELREALDEVRGEFLRHRSSWVVVGDSDLLQRIEHWHDEIRRTKGSISNEEGAWFRFLKLSPVHPPEMMIPPAKRRLGEYQALLGTGEALETDVQQIKEPKPSTLAPPSEAVRARERVATRLLLIAGQFSTLAHWLMHTNNLPGIESVLTDIENLSSQHTHADLDQIGDAALGNEVIHYFRDTRGALNGARNAVKVFARARTTSNPDQMMATTMTQCRAHAEQNVRWGKELAAKVRGDALKS